MKRNAIKSELSKALQNKMLYLAIALGMVFCLMDAWENFKKVGEFHENLQWILGLDARIGTGHEGYSLFHLWMGIYPNTQGAYLFYAIWPVLAAMAYGWSYIEERRSGVYNQIVSRTNAKVYYLAKYIAVFVSGGLAVGIPVLLNLLLNALVCPYEPIPATFAVVTNTEIFSEFFHTCPWGYGLLWCGMTFLCGGVAACLCFLVGTKLRHGVMVMLTPYAIYMVLDALLSNLKTSVLKDVNYTLSPLWIINSVPGFANPEWLVFSILGLLTLISFSVGYWQVVKHELA